MGISLRKVVVVLAILTIAMTGATIYAITDSLREHARMHECTREPKTGLLIKATEVDHAPSYANVTTDPHPCLIEAVENPGEKIYVGVGSEEEEVAYQQVLHGPSYVEYEGKYYVILKVYVDLGLYTPHPLPVEVLGFSALGACWVGVVYVYFRKTKRGTREEKG